MGMAKRSYSKKGRNMEPSVMTLTFSLPIGPFTENYIDLSQVASLVNRRFYRQGINWAVAGFKILSPSAAVGEISISKLPNTWVMSNSWEKGFRTWQKMNKDATDEAPSVRPKFLDFKIYADAAHHDLGFGANLRPFNGGGLFTAGEWIASKYVIPDTTTGAGVNNYEVIATGASYPGVSASSGLNAVSLIEGYAASRGLPDIVDPNAPDDAADVNGTTPENWMSALFNDGTNQDDAVLSDMISENNEAPYPFENDGTHTDTQYPNGANQAPGLQLHDFEYVTTTTVGGTTRLKGGNFPCGLIKIESTNFGAGLDNAILLIDLVPGHHRGYLCEPMTEM